MTLRTRITLLTLGLLAVSLAVIGGAIFGLLRSHLYSNLREELTDATRQAVNVINLNPDTFIFAPDASRSDFDTLLSSSLYLQIDFLLEDNPTAQSLLRGDKVARRPLTSLLGANVLLLSTLPVPSVPVVPVALTAPPTCRVPLLIVVPPE